MRGQMVDVYLNENAQGRDIPTEVWEYRLGGYQVLKKWLCYRERKVPGCPRPPPKATGSQKYPGGSLLCWQSSSCWDLSTVYLDREVSHHARWSDCLGANRCLLEEQEDRTA